MPQRLATKIDALEAVYPPSWVPSELHATWRRLPRAYKLILTGSKPARASAEQVAAILAACDEAKRQRVIELLTRG